MSKAHTFHTPVMGIAFTVDTAVKIAKYGMNSVIFISDDVLLEKLRKMYSSKFSLPYTEISEKDEDSRANRITAYLNLVKKLAERKLDEVIASSKEVTKYFSMLPDTASLKQDFIDFTDKITDTTEIKKWLKENLEMGDINVNIMTKLDKDNYVKNEKLPVEYNDAHAALRGFANSDLASSMVFSAGMNPRLFSYIENFPDFFPDEKGYIKKKIILKVSDYRSALIQGKFLAKKGVWVSEYRIESGLNCGGHAFATDGFLMGPILEEFKNNKENLITSVMEILLPALEQSGRTVPKEKLPLKITAQGGVGTSEEHNFLLDYYKVDSVGWGTPFLLVPEATNVDDATLKQLVASREKDLFLSDASPLGIPFNNIRNSSKHQEKEAALAAGKPGSPCPKKFLALTSADDGKTICTASRKYQNAKMKELDAQKNTISEAEYTKKYNDLTAKECLCIGLSTSVMHLNDMDRKVEGDAVSICPGPNLAYFTKTVFLQEMAGHIYGKNNIMERTDRPNFFVKELELYLDYLQNKLTESKVDWNKKQERYFGKFVKNMEAGVAYYNQLFSEMSTAFRISKNAILKEFKKAEETLSLIQQELQTLKEEQLMA